MNDYKQTSLSQNVSFGVSSNPSLFIANNSNQPESNSKNENLNTPEQNHIDQNLCFSKNETLSNKFSMNSNDTNACSLNTSLNSEG